MAAVAAVAAVPREFRAAWIATVDNIDWPSRKGLSTAAAQSELDQLVARAAELHLNALVFQVRPCADALYESPLEPWAEWLTGTQGQAPVPKWDPLAHLIARCKPHGIMVHAWFNPFRAAHPAERSKPAATHVRVAEPGLCIPHGKHLWLDPSQRRAVDRFLAVLDDVVSRYDVDGVHIDDYFYPYPEGQSDFGDAASYARYRRAGGKLAVGDWRRDSINRLVARMVETVHRSKPWVQVGISPFGIARPGVPNGIAAGIDQFSQLYADVPLWLRNGWLDYLAPQLYWPIDQSAQSFATLLPWWKQQPAQGRHIWPGINPGRMLAAKPPTRATELADQLALLRNQPGSLGHIHFSIKHLLKEHPKVAGILREAYREIAVPPASPWLEDSPPPTLTGVALDPVNGRLRWIPSRDVRLVLVQERLGAQWRTLGTPAGSCGEFPLARGHGELAVTAFSKTMLAGPSQHVR